MRRKITTSTYTFVSNNKSLQTRLITRFLILEEFCEEYLTTKTSHSGFIKMKIPLNYEIKSGKLK